MRVESLHSWAAQFLQRADGKLFEWFFVGGTTAYQFWETLQFELQRPGELWIVSYQCARAWALFGLWGLLESGQARIAAGDHRAVYDPIAFAARSKPGLLVTEDPPNIVQLRLGSCPGKILWIDCRNWGVSVPPEIGRGKPTVGNLVSLVVRLDEMAASSSEVPLSPTAASAAWRGWRKDAKSYGIHCHANQAALDLERSAHLGGRCECFRLGKLPGRWFHLDFRSAYAAVMCEVALPVRLEWSERIDDERARGIQGDLYRTIATVTIETDEPAYPLMRSGEVIYPVGKFVTTLCGPELKDAYYKGRVEFWHEVAVYEMCQVTKKWASGLYDERCLADAREDAQASDYCKAVLNSLPGKLGYRHRCWDVVPGALAPEPWGEWHQIEPGIGVVRWRSMAGVCQRENTGGYGPDAVPAMAAWINSCARLKLLNAIRTAGWGNVAYVDTDCLIVNGVGCDRLIESGIVESGMLGCLEVRSCSDNVEVLGIKHYVQDDQVKYAGCPRGTYTMHADGVHQWYTPPACESVRRGAPNGDRSVLATNPGIKPYLHGVVGQDGVVKPHRL